MCTRRLAFVILLQLLPTIAHSEQECAVHAAPPKANVVATTPPQSPDEIYPSGKGGIVEVGVGRFLVGGSRGLFIYDSMTDTASRVALGPTGPANAEPAVGAIAKVPSGPILVLTSGGLFRLTPQGTDPARVDGLAASGETIFAISEDEYLISGDLRLNSYRLSTGQSSDLGETGRINDIQRISDDHVLIGTSRGLYEYSVRADSIAAVAVPLVPDPDRTEAHVESIAPSTHADALFIADGRILNFVDEPQPAVSVVLATEAIKYSKVVWINDSQALVASDAGLFALDLQTQKIIRINGPSGNISDIRAMAENSSLVASDNGLWRLSVFSPQKVSLEGVQEDGNLQIITKAYVFDDLSVLAQMDGVLFEIPAGSLNGHRIAGSVRTAILSATKSANNGALLFSTSVNLFRTIPAWNNAQISFENGAVLKKAAKQIGEIGLSIMLRHPCAMLADSYSLSLRQKRADRENWTPVRILHIDKKQGGAVLVANTSFPEAGDWQFQIVSNLRGKEELVGGPAIIQVAQRPSGQDILGLASRIGGILYVVSFLSLFLLSHWFAWAFRVVTDPIWSKVGVWPFFVLRHGPWAQQWVLQPWFLNVRRSIKSQRTYLEIPVESNDGAQIEASAVFERLGTANSICLQGRAGMGKTTIFREWQARYFLGEESSLRAAVRKYGFILVCGSVRSYATVRVDENNPEDWVLAIVRAELAKFGFEIADRDLLKGMMRSGPFAVALDGINEADVDESVAAFRREIPNVRLLVTSQLDLPASNETWRLPLSIRAHVRGLFVLWLGEAEGSRLEQRASNSGLLESIVSGYDARLIADLASEGAENARLPEDRISLYRTILESVRAPDGSVVTIDPIRELAWTLVLERRRVIHADDLKSFDSDLMAALMQDNVRLLRRLGDSFEFRHDQMRSFLAADWIVGESAGTETLTMQLGRSAIWACTRRDQQELWEFAVAMMPSEWLDAVWNFAIQNPAERAILQATVQARAQYLGQRLAIVESIA